MGAEAQQGAGSQPSTMPRVFSEQKEGEME